MAENPDFLLLEQLFSPSQRAANSMPAPHVSSPMPAQAATYTFNSPLLPTLNKDNVLTAIFGEPGASPELPAPTEEEEERPPKEPANEREKKGQKASRTFFALSLIAWAADHFELNLFPRGDDACCVGLFGKLLWQAHDGRCDVQLKTMSCRG